MINQGNRILSTGFSGGTPAAGKDGIGDRHDPSTMGQHKLRKDSRNGEFIKNSQQWSHISDKMEDIRANNPVKKLAQMVALRSARTRDTEPEELCSKCKPIGNDGKPSWRATMQ